MMFWTIRTAEVLRDVFTVEPRYNDPRYNDIRDITMNILCPGKSYCKMYGKESRYNDDNLADQT